MRYINSVAWPMVNFTNEIKYLKKFKLSRCRQAENGGTVFAGRVIPQHRYTTPPYYEFQTFLKEDKLNEIKLRKG